MLWTVVGCWGGQVDVFDRVGPLETLVPGHERPALAQTRAWDGAEARFVA